VKPFFVDANVVVYAAVEGPGRESCLRVLEAVAARKAEGRTSPAVLEEVWHVVQRRYPEQLDGLVESALKIFSPLLPVTEEDLSSALAMEDSDLDPNDRLHLGTCLNNQIGVVLTADRAYDAAPGISRVDPLDPAAVEGLLTGELG
jgi:predicted nucleic acid-binding protein